MGDNETVALASRSSIRDQAHATCIEILAGHSSWVGGLAFAPDGSRMASASWEAGQAVELGKEAPAPAAFGPLRRGTMTWLGVRMEAPWPVQL